MFEGLRKPKTLVVIVVTLLAYGCPVQAIVQALGLDERTVAVWRDRQQIRLTGEEAQAQRAEIEAERAEAAIRKVEALAEKLCSLGINPDEI